MAIESALGRAVPREKAPPGTNGKNIINTVATRLRAGKPFEQAVAVEISAKTEINQPLFLRIDKFFSRLKHPAITEARKWLREVQVLSQLPEPEASSSEKKRPLTKPATVGLIRGSSKIVDRIINSMKEREFTSGEWSERDGNGISDIKTVDPEIKFELRAPLPGNKKHVGLNIVLSEQAIVALAKSPNLPDLEPAKK